MEIKKMVQNVKKIEMSEEMQQRILNNCYEKMEEHSMKKKSIKHNFRKMVVVAAALGLCLCLAGGTAALAGGKQEFFKEIKRGAGRYNLVYEQATEEVQLNVSADDTGVSVEVTFVDADGLPYCELEAIGLKQYQVLKEDGSVAVEGTKTDTVEVARGKANILLELEQLPSGTYTLVVTQLIAEKKADAPLVITGDWECTFGFENLEQ